MPSKPPFDDCDRPACDDVKSMFSKASKALAAANSDKTGEPTTSRTGKTTKIECPPNSAVIGQGSWNLLHSMAAWYPDNPSDDDKMKMKNFFDALARFYPCTYCADDFSKELKKSPVRTESRTELCKWLCEQHNVVNKKLGKKEFSCEMDVLDERWRKSSDPSC